MKEPKHGEWVPLREHLLALREADLKFDEERDRRGAEVATEREKALKIKETADLAALQLARDIQTYKDEKANELREQISSERGMYATKADMESLQDKFLALLAPISAYVTARQGRSGGQVALWGALATVAGLVLLVVGIYLSNK